jgi:hypothetical protein
MPGALSTRPAARDLERLARPPEWLRRIADPDVVASALRPNLRVVGCELVRLRIKAESNTAVYRITVLDGSGGNTVSELRGEIVLPGQPQPPTGMHGVLGDANWRCSLPELHLVLSPGAADAALSALPALMEPTLACEVLARAVREAGDKRYAGFRIDSCTVDVKRHKPGSRCTALYRLELPVGSPRYWPRRVVGKTYWGGKGQVAWDAMTALWQSPLGSSPVVAIAEPIGFLPEERVLVQRSLLHAETFKDLLRRVLSRGDRDPLAALGPVAARIGRGLAELHRSGVVSPVEHRWEDEAAEVRAVTTRLARLVPALDGVGTEVLARLEARSATEPAQPCVPTHGSFRPAQVMLDGHGGIGFIDFDSFCMAEPAFDVALFCTSLRDSGLRAGLRRGGRPADHLAVLDELCEVVVAGYRGAASLSQERLELWSALHVITGVQHCWTKVKFDRLPYRLELLDHELARGAGG